MKLTDFELDLPYILNQKHILLIIDNNRCSHNEATKLDYQNNWKEKRRKFSLETRCITAFFARLFKSFNTKDCRKILVECVESIFQEKIINFSGVYTVQVQFDYNSFLALDNLGKKKKALELLMIGIKQIAFEQNWDIELFEHTYAKILESDYKNEWIWKKCARNPVNGVIANVILKHEVNQMDIYIVIHDNDGIEISKEKVISEKPDEYAYSEHLGEIKWLDTNKVILVNKKNDKEWLVSF